MPSKEATTMADTDEQPAGSSGVAGHRGWVWSLIALAAVIALVSSLTVWVKRQALDTDAWTRASAALLEDDQVREVLSTYIVDQLYTNGDVSGDLQKNLPPTLAGLAAPLAGALRAPAVDAVDRLLAGPRVQQLWLRVNRVAHERLLAILEGNPRANVSTTNGEVVLDLRSFIVEVGTQLGIGDQLEQRLPPDVGQVTVLKSGELATAQDAVKAIKALSWLLFLVTLVLWAAALWLARGWRRVALRGIGASLLLIGLLLLVIRQAAGNYVVNALASGDSIREAAHSTWLIGTTLLAEVAWAAVIYGLVIVVGAWLAGPSKIAVNARARVAPVLAERPGLAWTVAGVTFLLVVWWGPTPALRRPLGVLVLGLLAAVGFELLRRIAVAERAAPSIAPNVPSQAQRDQGLEART
jgi:hypothetical protein